MNTISFGDIQWQVIAGGLALFLFGMTLMGNSLTKFAGTKLRDYIERYTGNPVIAVLVGIVMTGLIQSSSATTIIVIGLIRSDLMRLEQAIGVILGANIGTTVTSIMIGFDVDYLAYFLALVGVIMMLFAKRKRMTYLGEIILGFGMLFIGLNLMGDSLKQLQHLPGFNDAIVRMSDFPVLGTLIGALFTGILQSSSAIVGIVQVLYNNESITLIAMLGLIFGANIGTTVTAGIAAFGGTTAAKRTSLFHFLFNLSVSAMFLLLIRPYSGLVTQLSTLLGLNRLMTVALAHFIFNFIGTLLFLPFVKPLARSLERVIPGKDEPAFDAGKIIVDDQLIREFPAGAMQEIQKHIDTMADMAREALDASKQFALTKDRKFFTRTNAIEAVVNSTDTQLSTYLVRLSRQGLTEELFEEYSQNLQLVKNLERISDLSQNLVEFYEIIYDARDDFADEAREELGIIYARLQSNYEKALRVFSTGDPVLYNALKEDEHALNTMELNFRDAHFHRLSTGTGRHAEFASLYIDILSTIERIGDHAFNIGALAFEPVKTHREKIPAYIPADAEGSR